MDETSLGDFLTAAATGYSTYQSGATAADANKTAAANLAAQQATLANTNALSSQTKTYLVIGGGVLIGIITLILLFKRK